MFEPEDDSEYLPEAQEKHIEDKLCSNNIQENNFESHFKHEKWIKEKCSNKPLPTIILSSNIPIELHECVKVDSANCNNRFNDSLRSVDSISNSSQHSNIENSNIKKRFGRNEDRGKIS